MPEAITALLPGLYFVGLAALLGAALRRWYDAVPARLLALFALLPLLLFGRALLGGEVLLPLGNLSHVVPFRELPPPERPSIGLQGDLVNQIAPWQVEVRRAMAEGRWPLWNVNAGAGMPLMGDPQTQAFQPIVMAAYPFDVWAGLGITGALRVLLALVFLFLFLRRLGMGEPAAVLGSLGFGLGGFLMLWLGWPMASSAAFLPMGLYAVDRVGRRRVAGGIGRRDSFLLYLAALCLFLGGHPETVLYALGLMGLLLLSCAWSRRKPGDGDGDGNGNGSDPAQPFLRRPWVRILVQGGAAMGLAGLTAAPVLVPAQELLPTTQRAAVLAAHLAPRPLGEIWDELVKPETLAFWGGRAERRVLPAVAPRAYGDHTFYWGDVNLIEDAGGFAGTLTLLLALAALVPGARTRLPHERLVMAVLAGSLLLICQPPGFEYLAARLPVIGPTAAHRHHRVLILVVLAIAWLAACEAERWRRGETRRAVMAGLGAALGGLIAWAYQANPPKIAGLLEEQRADWLAVQLAALGIGLAGLVLLTLPARERWRRAPTFAAWGLAAVVAAELLVFHLPANPSGPRRLAYPVTPPLRFLLEHRDSQGADRMVGLSRSVFPANYNLVYGLADVRIDNPSLPGRYAKVVSLVSRESLAPSFGRPAVPLYDLLGVRHVLTRPGVELPAPLKVVFRHRTGWVWERPGALPRLFLPARGFVFSGGDWREWLDRNPNFAARALFQSSGVKDRNWRARKPKASKLTLLALESATLKARADLAERRLLASSVYQDGNWHLLDGGERQPTLLANGPFLAAWLPAGDREIVFLYRPAALLTGCLLAALALAGAAAWWVKPPRLTPPRARDTPCPPSSRPAVRP